MILRLRANWNLKNILQPVFYFTNFLLESRIMLDGVEDHQFTHWTLGFGFSDKPLSFLDCCPKQLNSVQGAVSAMVIRFYRPLRKPGATCWNFLHSDISCSNHHLNLQTKDNVSKHTIFLRSWPSLSTWNHNQLVLRFQKSFTFTLNTEKIK